MRSLHFVRDDKITSWTAPDSIGSIRQARMSCVCGSKIYYLDQTDRAEANIEKIKRTEIFRFFLYREFFCRYVFALRHSKK